MLIPIDLAIEYGLKLLIAVNFSNQEPSLVNLEPQGTQTLY